MKNYTMPAEWEKQEALLLCYPSNGNDWPGKYAAVLWVFIEYISTVAQFQKVLVVVSNLEFKDKVLYELKRNHANTDQIEFIFSRSNRSWMRDSAPIIVKTGNKKLALNFNFNGWAKYTNYQLDKQIPKAVAYHLNIDLEKVKYKNLPFILEGGAIEVNGQGTLITTEECLLDKEIQARNRNFTTKEAYQSIFQDYLGIKQTIWLNKGIEGDDTHGHIDDLCRFIDEKTVVCVQENNPKDQNYTPLKENWERLQNIRLHNGKKLELLSLPMPRPIWFDGIRLPASYANFIIINEAVLVPTFNDPNDYKAIGILQDCFPTRKVIGIHSLDLIWGLGTLHCLSQQVPV
jgi:agmatine deiminase